MDNVSPTKCKVLVYDHSTEHVDRIKIFCDNNNLIAVKPHEENIMDLLKTNVDLGAIILSDTIDNKPGAGIELGVAIHNIRPELPILLRTETGIKHETLNPKQQRAFCTVFDIDEIDSLRSTIEEHIFSTHYPNALIRGIKEITTDSLNHFFEDIDLEVSVPYLVKDRIIYGELFSLIPLESSWCRGYMTLQSDEEHVIEMVKGEKLDERDPVNFRIINDVLSEITNMIWGSVKNRFIAADDNYRGQLASQVPIVVNHAHKYITFGTDMPQLCFKYTIRQSSGAKREITLFQKFIFNLSWNPQKFAENQPTVDDFLDSGELEFF